MPQPKKAARFGNSAAHHNLMMANLTTELIRHGRITTTFAKAKTVQPLAERMVTFGKRGDLHARRQVLKVVRDADVVRRLFDDVGPAFAERNGGYTRVLKLGARKGDAAQMALIEFTEQIGGHDDEHEEQGSRRRWGLRRRRAEQTGEQESAAPSASAPAAASAAASAGEAAAPAAAGRPETGEPTAEDLVEADPAEVDARLAAAEDADAAEADDVDTVDEDVAEDPADAEPDGDDGTDDDDAR